MANATSDATGGRYRRNRFVQVADARRRLAMTDTTDEDPLACRACSAPVTETGDRRVVSVVENGEAVHYQFCSEACLESWDRP